MGSENDWGWGLLAPLTSAQSGVYPSQYLGSEGGFDAVRVDKAL
jgi:hypothetical protein